MKACAILEPGKAGFKEVEESRPGSGQVLVGMRQMGLCGTDLQYFAGRLVTDDPGKRDQRVLAAI